MGVRSIALAHFIAFTLAGVEQGSVSLLPNSRDTIRIRPATDWLLCPRGTPSVEKDHNQAQLFRNQDDNSTGKNTCQASNALAVRLRRIYTFSPYR